MGLKNNKLLQGRSVSQRQGAPNNPAGPASSGLRQKQQSSDTTACVDTKRRRLIEPLLGDASKVSCAQPTKSIYSSSSICRIMLLTSSHMGMLRKLLWKGGL